MSAFKEIQKGNFKNWTDEDGKITRFFRINENFDVADTLGQQELIVSPSEATQTFPADGYTTLYTKVTVLAGEDRMPTVVGETLTFTTENAAVRGGELNV